jgi:hypothetical protein
VNVAGKQSQIFAEVEKLLELFKNNCQIHLCTGQSRVENWKADGGRGGATGGGGWNTPPHSSANLQIVISVGKTGLAKDNQ